MKHIKILLMLSISLLFLTNCQQVNSPVPDSDSYFPVNTGNYWVYEIQLKSDIYKIEKVSRDSMVCIGVKYYYNYRIAVCQYFIDGFLKDTVEFWVSPQMLYLKSKALNPLMPLDQGSCMTGSPDTVKPIIRFGFDRYDHSDTLFGSDWILVPDGQGGYETIMSLTGHEFIYKIIRKGTSLINVAGIDYPSNQYTISMTRKWCMYEPYYKSEIMNDGWLELSLAEGLGIAESKSVINRCDSIVWNKTMKLVDFKILR